MTFRTNRAPLLSIIKPYAWFHHHMWIQTGVTVRKRLSWVVTSVTLTFDLWPWPFAWTSLWSLVITPQNFMMIRWWEHSQLDESTARRQLKSPRSLSGRSIHQTLVTKWLWSWSWMTYCHLLCAMSISPPILRYSYFKIWPWKSMVKVMCVVKGEGHGWPWKFKGQGYGQGQTQWSHLRPGIQSICLLFV